MTAAEDVEQSVLDELIDVAQRSPARYMHSAAILDRSLRPICYGYNRGYQHAEHMAIDKFLRTPKFRGKKGAVLLVIRTNKSRGLLKSDPCAKCVKEILAAGLRTIHT